MDDSPLNDLIRFFYHRPISFADLVIENGHLTYTNLPFESFTKIFANVSKQDIYNYCKDFICDGYNQLPDQLQPQFSDLEKNKILQTIGDAIGNPDGTDIANEELSALYKTITNFSNKWAAEVFENLQQVKEPLSEEMKTYLSNSIGCFGAYQSCYSKIDIDDLDALSVELQNSQSWQSWKFLFWGSDEYNISTEGKIGIKIPTPEEIRAQFQNLSSENINNNDQSLMIYKTSTVNGLLEMKWQATWHLVHNAILAANPNIKIQYIKNDLLPIPDMPVEYVRDYVIPGPNDTFYFFDDIQVLKKTDADNFLKLTESMNLHIHNINLVLTEEQKDAIDKMNLGDGGNVFYDKNRGIYFVGAKKTDDISDEVFYDTLHQFTSALELASGTRVVSVPFVKNIGINGNSFFYHLDLIMNLTNDGKMIVYPDVIEASAYAQVKKLVGEENLIEVDAETAEKYGLNFVSTNHVLVMPACSEAVEKQLMQNGYSVLTPAKLGLGDTAFKFFDAGPHCITLDQYHDIAPQQKIVNILNDFAEGDISGEEFRQQVESIEKKSGLTLTEDQGEYGFRYRDNIHEAIVFREGEYQLSVTPRSFNENLIQILESAIVDSQQNNLQQELNELY